MTDITRNKMTLTSISKKVWLLPALLLVLCVVASCGKHSDSPTEEILTVSPATLSLSPNASGTISVTSNTAWTVTAPAGFTATPASGSNNGTITVTAGDSPKAGFLTVKSKTKSASVALSGPESASVTVTPNKGSVSYESGKSTTFQVSCAGAWSITLASPKPSWLASVSPMSGTGDATVTVTTGSYTERTSAQTYMTVVSGKYSAYYTITKEAAPNVAPTKPTNLKPTGSGVETVTTFSWTASTDGNGDKITYTVMISKNNSSWTTVGTTESTSLKNTTAMDKNTTYYYKVVADDGYDGGKTESDVVTFTTGSSQSSWTDGQVKQYNVNSDGSITEVTLGSSPRPVKLIFTGDGYTEDLFTYGGQFDQEVDAGVKALFEYEPYKTYYSYFTVYKVAAFSKEAGMSQGDSYDNPKKKVNTVFHCTWEGGNSTGIDCDADAVFEYACKVPGIQGATELESETNLTYSPVCIIINAYAYAGTNIWLSDDGIGGMKMISIAQTPARQPSYSSTDGFAFTLRHEYGGHGFGLLDDEYVYYTTQYFPHDEEESFRFWQGEGAFCNTYLPEWNSSASTWYSDDAHCNLNLTPSVSGENWASFASKTEYAGANIHLVSGSSYYGRGVYRSENGSCMIDNIPHFNTISRWKIYSRIKITAGETPTIEDFMSRDTDKTNSYGSAAPMTKASSERRCRGPLLKDAHHRRPYRLHK